MWGRRKAELPGLILAKQEAGKLDTAEEGGRVVTFGCD